MNGNELKTNRLLAAGFLVVIVAVLIGGGVALYRSGIFSGSTTNTPTSEDKFVINTDTASEKSVASIDTSDWVPYPYFSDSVNFYLFIPSEWTTPSLDQIYDYFTDEGSFLWFQPTLGVNDQSISFSVGKYRDTGQDLDTWVRLKSVEIESARSATATWDNITYNDIPMVKVCSDGTISSSPAPVCFVYMHQDSWIIELRIESYSSFSYALVQQYADVYSSQFHFLKDTSSWPEYSSFNNGFSVRYPADILPLDTLPAHFVTSFHTVSSDKIFQVITTYGATSDLEKYWYDIQNNEVILTSKHPNEIQLNGQRCFSYVMQSEGSNMYELLCKVNSKLYKIEMWPAMDQDILSTMLDMLSTFKFTTDNIVADRLNIFKEDAQFQLTYPNSYSASEEGGFDSTYLGFYENITYERPRRGFSVSFQKTEKSIETCTNETYCFLYGIDLKLYNQSILKGMPAFVRSYNIEYDNNNTQTITNYIFIKNVVMYSINVNAIGTTGNADVNAMLESMSFL
ncbi:MAG: hypothetical protein WC544_02975 [Patescibacteria group bacterium]